jgi:hypothetical protein
MNDWTETVCFFILTNVPSYLSPLGSESECDDDISLFATSSDIAVGL